MSNPVRLVTNPYPEEHYGCHMWYQQCNCCPYGYHIDLDFVRYCESIEQVDRTGSIKKRKQRRRQRHSMEVLLGLEQPTLLNVEQFYQKMIDEESPRLVRKQVKLNQSSIQDDLDEVVFNFEQTLQRSNRHSHNLPDVTGVHEMVWCIPSTSTMSSISKSSMHVLPSTSDTISEDYDIINTETSVLTPATLQNIRQQMMLSLERTKELEEQVKLIPSLQEQLSILKEEKNRLLLQIKELQHTELNSLNKQYIKNSVTLPYNQHQSQSLSQSISDQNISTDTHPPLPVPRRDFGVMCSVLTRNIGIGHQYPITKSVSTTTLINGFESHYTDKWFNEKMKFLANNHSIFLSTNLMNVFKGTSPITISKETQTCLAKENSDNFTQTVEVEKLYHNVGTLAVVTTSNANSEAIVQTDSIGISDHTLDDIFCLGCNSNKNLQHDNILSTQRSSISLASLTVPRSKSFNFESDKLNLIAHNRSVACQHEIIRSHKACQYESKTQAKSCQSDIKMAHKNIQSDNNYISKFTDTNDLDNGKHITYNTEDKEIQTTKITSNMCIPEGTEYCKNCSKKEHKSIIKDDNFMPSKIPRPQATILIENKKIRRQNTYTKITASVNNKSGLSGLDLDLKSDNELLGPFEKVKTNYELPVVSISQNNDSLSSKYKSETTLLLPENDLCQPIAQDCRKKVYPSKEMQAAMKVLNDSLQKGQTKNLKNQLKNAINIIQQEWFKISSLINADPLNVEDYLDNFEDISSDLLHYIVNMVDISGNTAMHYAVSHGNFDVVSILLDSKVCDINQPNKAGYTSVMLVSLASICSATHANVVRRLFQLSDVNIRAKQHGQTALMLAVSHGRLDMVKMLLEAGADINIQDEDGSTALMCAAEHGQIDIVKHFLSQRDCDSTITDVDGSTALQIAMEAGHRHIGILLYAHERNLQGIGHNSQLKQNKSLLSIKPNTPSSSALPLRNSHCALTDKKRNK